MTTYICHETFDGIRTGRRWTLHSLDDLADVWEEHGDGTAYEETTARRLLREYADVTPETVAAYIADEGVCRCVREAAVQIAVLAERYGWDTTLYRADYLNGTDGCSFDRYSPNTIDREAALIAAWQHGDPDDFGWEVEKKAN